MSNISISQAFIPLINKTLSAKSTTRATLLQFLSKSSQFKELVSYLIDSEYLETDIKRKESYMYIIEDIILNKKGSIECLDSDQIKKIVRILIEFPVENSDTMFFDRMKRTFNLVFQPLNEEKANEMFTLITEPEGLYTPIALSILCSVQKSLIDKSFPKLIDALNTLVIAKLNAFVLFMESQKLSEMSDECGQAWDSFGGDSKLIDVIKPLLISDFGLQRIGFRIIAATFNFLPSERSILVFFTLSTPILEILNKSNDSTRLQIASIFGKLPPGNEHEATSPTAQLRTFLKELSIHLTNCEGLYANEFITFVEARKESPDFVDIVGDLYREPETTRAAILLSAQFNIFSREAKMLENAFPANMTDRTKVLAVLDVVPFIVKNRKITKESFVAISNCVYSIFRNPQFTGDASIRPLLFCFVSLYIPLYGTFPNEFVNAYASNIAEINDKEILCCFACELCRALPSFKDAEIESLSNDLIAKIFIHLAEFFIGNENGLSDFTSLLRALKPSITETPKTITEMIDLFIPKECIPIIKTEFMELAKTKLNYCIYTMYLPSLAPSEISEVVKIVITTPKSQKEDNQVNKDLVVSVFKAISMRYLNIAFNSLKVIATEKEKSSFLFFGMKQKQFRQSVKIALLVSLSKILDPPPAEQLPQNVQDTIYTIITKSMPDVDDIKEFPDTQCVIDVFPLLNSTLAPEELLIKIVGIPLFAECLTSILTTQKYASKYIELAILSWIDHLSFCTLSMAKNQEVAEMIFRISPTVGSYSLILTKLLTRFGNDDALPFIDFCYYCASCAERLDIKPELDLLNKVLLAIAPLSLSFSKEIRVAAFHTLMIIFHVPTELPEGDELKEVDLILSEEVGTSMCIVLFKRIITSAPEQFSKIVTESIISQKSMTFTNSLIIRGIFEVNGQFVLSSSPSSVMALFNTLSSMKGKERFQIMSSLIDLSQKSMAEFIPVLISSNDISFKREIVSRLLQSEQRRALFFDQFNTLLLGVTKSLSLFQILPAVVTSEKSSSISPKAFGSLMQSIVIWITSIYANEDSVNRTSINKAKEEIMQCITFVMEKTNVGSVQPFEIKFHGFDDLAATLESLVKNLAGVDIEHITSFCFSIGNLITSKNEAFRQAAGIIFIYLQSAFGMCTNLAAVQLCTKLLISVAVSFKSTNNKSRRKLAALIQSNLSYEYIKKMQTEHSIVLFKALIENLASDEKENGKKALDVLSLVLPKIPVEELDKMLDNILAACRKIAETQAFSMEFLDILEAYVQRRPLFTDFAYNMKLNLIYLMNLLSRQRKDVKTRVSKLISLIVGNLSQIDLGSVMKQESLLSFAYEVVPRITLETATEDLLQLLFIIIRTLCDVDTKEVNDFRSQVVQVCSELANGTQFSDKALEILHEIIP